MSTSLFSRVKSGNLSTLGTPKIVIQLEFLQILRPFYQEDFFKKITTEPHCFDKKFKCYLRGKKTLQKLKCLCDLLGHFLQPVHFYIITVILLIMLSVCLFDKVYSRLMENVIFGKIFKYLI